MEIVAATLYSLDLLILFAFQFLNRDYGVFTHPVSTYGIGKTARAFKLYMLVGSIAAPLLAWQIWSATDPTYPVASPLYLLVVMAARLVLAFFPNDARGAPRSLSGQIHHLATVVAFTCAFMTTTEVTPLLAATVGGVPAEALLWSKHLISLGFVAVVVTIAQPMRRYFGLAERLYLYATGLWFLTASLILPPL